MSWAGPKAGCQRSVLVSIHSQRISRRGGDYAVKDLCWCQSTASEVPRNSNKTLSKICAGVNPQLSGFELDHTGGCQRSVLVSIHSQAALHLRGREAVKDLCWCQSTACFPLRPRSWRLSKICAGVNPQLGVHHLVPVERCQRSVLVSIHSKDLPGRPYRYAVKDLCWCQSTAWVFTRTYTVWLSKICAGVNPQLLTVANVGVARCQRSVLVSIHSKPSSVAPSAIAVKDLCWCQSTASSSTMSRRTGLSKICAGVNPQLRARRATLQAGCQRSVLVSIHSDPGTCLARRSAVKDLCWCQSTASSDRVLAVDVLSKICAGVNPQQHLQQVALGFCCQRSVLVSIHSVVRLQLNYKGAVKDLCWCQSTASKFCSVTNWRLSKICAGVNPQLADQFARLPFRCQRSVLVSIHSPAWVMRDAVVAVKDLCWCQSTAARASWMAGFVLSKICAGVNPQPMVCDVPIWIGCQRSVLVSIHSIVGTMCGEFRAVKDLCWCQSTAAPFPLVGLRGLSKICAGVNPQLDTRGVITPSRCQRSVLVSIHSFEVMLPDGTSAVKDLCWCQSTAMGAQRPPDAELSKICAGVNPQLMQRVATYEQGCQRSVLVSIHSLWKITDGIGKAVKDLCWCQSTAISASRWITSWLSKICAGVNPQQHDDRHQRPDRCQRSVLVSIHSSRLHTGRSGSAVKDLCWCQSTAYRPPPAAEVVLSKICAGVNPQLR